MTIVAAVPGSAETLADLVNHLGDIPLERIRIKPPSGTATERICADLRDSAATSSGLPLPRG
jgi:hypothetical protein